jgi:hypothetical protein
VLPWVSVGLLDEVERGTRGRRGGSHAAAAPAAPLARDDGDAPCLGPPLAKGKLPPEGVVLQVGCVWGVGGWVGGLWFKVVHHHMVAIAMFPPQKGSRP